MTIKRFFGVRFAFSAILAIWFIATPCATWANIRLPAIISDNMVLQQKTTIPLWGWSHAGGNIRITVDWSGDFFQTTADSNGLWKIKIITPPAGGPYKLTITGDNNDIHEIKQVLVGEVWLCSGQSNMEMPVGRVRGYGGVDNYKQEVISADYSDIRLFFVERKSTAEPQSDCIGSWAVCGPQTAEKFSATAYFFGRELYKVLKVPIGLIDSSWGGTPAEAWTSRDALLSNPAFSPILKRFEEAVASYPNAEKEYKQKMELWEKALAEAKTKGGSLPAEPLAPMGLGHYQSPAGLFNGMISPLITYEIKGVIWYQGESNVGRAYQYRTLFPALIRDWRNGWGQNFPFYYVQIAPWLGYEAYKGPAAAELREAQLLTLSVPDTGMVVTTDIGDVNDVHPKNKQEVGRRLALWALSKTYDHNDILCSGPLYKSMRIEENKIRIYFDFVGSGLAARGESLRDFSIAGKDRNFVPAKANIDGKTVVVWSDQVDKPVSVHFGWSNTSSPNLFNKESLPASPFRTDDWPAFTFDKK